MLQILAKNDLYSFQNVLFHLKKPNAKINSNSATRQPQGP